MPAVVGKAQGELLTVHHQRGEGHGFAQGTLGHRFVHAGVIGRASDGGNTRGKSAEKVNFPNVGIESFPAPHLLISR